MREAIFSHDGTKRAIFTDLYNSTWWHPKSLFDLQDVNHSPDNVGCEADCLSKTLHSLLYPSQNCWPIDSVCHIGKNLREKVCTSVQKSQLYESSNGKKISTQWCYRRTKRPMYKLLPSSLIGTPRSTAQAKQQKKFRNSTIEIISDLNSVNCPSLKTEVNSTPTRPVENVLLTTKGLQERNMQMLDGTTVENKGKTIYYEKNKKQNSSEG